jgi:hypothetical protein
VVRFELELRDQEEVLHLHAGTRQQLVAVLTEWLGLYAGVDRSDPSPENFDLVVELRRVLLEPDERHGGHHLRLQAVTASESAAVAHYDVARARCDCTTGH